MCYEFRWYIFSPSKGDSDVLLMEYEVFTHVYQVHMYVIRLSSSQYLSHKTRSNTNSPVSSIMFKIIHVS